MTMFHLQYPASKKFLTWDELGCLCRALGFPKDLFRDNFPHDIFEIKYDEKGILVETILRMFELNLLYKALHRTFNMHTADWNTCVISRAIYMLGHNVLDFEGVHNVRVAYMMYEHIDMKGMLINKHILLRTLKLCGRTIAPLKLMHRIKHMKAEFEEKGRIQLYEFFNLILWCDLYTAYKPEDMETSSGKEEELYRLVDFHRLLSHHDERAAKQLNEQYLKEEWDFGMECLGPKEMFKEPPVYTDARITQAQYHKQNYRHLKHEVGQSQRRVYRSLAGSVRPRPISAPDLDKYRIKEKKQGPRDTSAHAAYESVQKRLHSAPCRGSTTTPKLPERPHTSEYVRVKTPSVVTPRDLDDVQVKMENLQFDIDTLGSRCQLQVENEMDFYLPGYKEKLANRKPVETPLPEPERKQVHWTSKIINGLAYPPSNLKPAHAKSCDARFRGWRKANTRPGYHCVVTAQTYENSEKGRMFSKMEQTIMAPVEYLHPEYVVRYTSKNQVPTSVDNLAKKSKQKSQRQPTIRFRSLEAKEGDPEEKVNPEEERRKNAEGAQKPKPIRDLEFFHNKYLSDESHKSDESSKPPADTRKPNSSSGDKPKPLTKQSCPRPLVAKQTADSMTGSMTKIGNAFVLRPSDESRHDIHPEVHMRSHVDIDWPEDVPVPHMEHSGPKIIGVGQIGTISLLESIEESRDLEEKFVESPRKETLVDDVFDDDSIKAVDDDGAIGERVDDDNDDEDYYDLRLNLSRQRISETRPSKSQPSSQQKRAYGAHRRRTSQSAPSARSSSGNNSKRSTPRKKSRRGTAPTSAKAASRMRGVSEATSKTEDYEDENGESSTTNNESISPVYVSTSNSYSSPDHASKFKSFRGSVTSEESEKENGGNRYVKQEDESSYSDEMTLASSMGMAELPESPLTKQPIRVGELGDSMDSKSFSALRFGPRIELQLIEDLDRTYSSSSNPSPLGKDSRYSSISERKDSIKIVTDYREYLSDSDVKKKTFSRAARSRLVGRVDKIISPDLKLRLMAGDPAISVPAV